MTLATDYALGALSLVLGILVLRRGRSAGKVSWAWTLLSCAMAAFLGGTYHGFAHVLPEAFAVGLWKMTMGFIGGAAFSATMATARDRLPARAEPWIAIAAGLQLGVYLWVVLSPAVRSGDDFLTAIIDYSLAFAFVLAVHATIWLRSRDRDAGWVAASVVVSFFAAGIQAAGIAPHPHFNHNDLFHVVQMIGTWMLYRGIVDVAPDARPS